MKDAAQPVQPAVRADRWLWAARFYKSRALAAQACDGGKVSVNGQAAKPHRLVRVNDVLLVTHPAGPKILNVVGLAERRGSAQQAGLLYEDKSPPAPPRERRSFLIPPLIRPPGAGRPTKRERRALGRVRGS